MKIHSGHEHFTGDTRVLPFTLLISLRKNKVKINALFHKNLFLEAFFDRKQILTCVRGYLTGFSFCLHCKIYIEFDLC